MPSIRQDARLYGMKETTRKRLHDIKVPLEALMALPTTNKVVGCIESENIFNDSKIEPALIVIFRDSAKDGGGVRTGLFSVADGTYLGEY